MALNPFFLQGSPNEQSLVQQLIDEHLKMFGLDCYYIPRKMIITDDVLGEVQSSKFNDAYILVFKTKLLSQFLEKDTKILLLHLL